MRNAGQVVSKTMILSHVWEYNFDPQTNIVDVLVSRLREKIDRPFEKKLLHTVRGVGYVLRRSLSSGVLPALLRAFGLRLALWYATLFVVGAIAIVVRHLLPDRGVARAARSPDHPAASSASTRARLRARRRRRVLAATVRAEQQAAPERLFVRVVDRGVEGDRRSATRRLGPVDARDRLARGSPTARSSRSARAPRRATICWRASAPRSASSRCSIVVIALTGGCAGDASRRCAPIRRLTEAVRRIIAHRPHRRARAARRAPATRSTS